MKCRPSHCRASRFVLMLLCALAVPLACPLAHAAGKLQGTARGEHGLEVQWKVIDNSPDKTAQSGFPQSLSVKAFLNGREVQTLEYPGMYRELTEEFTPPLAIADYNFDGHDDVYLYDGINFRGSYGGIFLFNPRTGQFGYNERFSEISVREVDRQRERVICKGSNSAVEYVYEEYAVHGFDTLVLMYEEGVDQVQDQNGTYRYREYKREYKDGKIISRKETLRDK